MALQKFLDRLFSYLMIASLIFSAAGSVQAKTPLAPGANAPTASSVGAKPLPTPSPAESGPSQPTKKITPAERQAAADANTSKGFLPGVAGKQLQSQLQASGKSTGSMAPQPQISPIDETVVPHFFGPFANYANSPMPRGPILDVTLDAGGAGYSQDTNVEIVDAYGTGSGAVASAIVDVNGVIAGITVVDPGVDYTAPIAVITDVSGSGAAATPNLNPAVLSGGLLKFIDALPQLGPSGMNLLGQYLSIAKPDTISFPGSDYYEIELIEFSQKLHSNLPPTTLRGYRQTNLGTDGLGANTLAPDPIKYLGPLIIASRNTPVRIKFTNSLPTGEAGDLFLPVDTNVMGAGLGGRTAAGALCNPEEPQTGANICAPYTDNRATLHMHGGLVPWISDGTPHQWVTPAGETTPYPKGVSVRYVPDMWYLNGVVVPAGTPGATNNPGDGSLTFYYNNQQSARLHFYHDHAYGITRLNVYAGEVAGYLVTDEIEQDLINGTNVTGVNPGLDNVLPGVGVPLIIQDKSFVDETTISTQDPTWRWGTGAKDPLTGRRAPKTGDLWVSSVYMPVQNPWDTIGGANAFGRWQYGPWFWPPTENVTHPPVANEYYDPNCDASAGWCEPPMRPASSTPSMGMEAYNDTMLVNGTAYPFMNVDPKIYRFRVLNGANDRFVNLQMYVADPTQSNPYAGMTEVKMVDAVANPLYPATFPGDGRVGGAPDPLMAGPAWIQIGTEGGFLPAPVVIENQAITWQTNPGLFNVGNVLDHSLLIGNAERADVLVDFSQYAGKTIILYNDAPTAFPALDPRYDYYTGSPNQMDSGGAPTTLAGYGPNTRTIMQFRVSGTAAGTFPNNAYNPAYLALLESAFAKGPAPEKRGVFERGSEQIIVPQAAYNSAYGTNTPDDASQYVKITDRGMTFTPYGQTQPVTITFQEKAIHDEMGATYDPNYGHMGGMLGLEIPGTNNLNQNIILYGYAVPPVDVMSDSGLAQIGTLGDGTQLWKITHNGVDTHPIHFHLVNVQVINRVGWDGLLLVPDANELGWKETLRINPLESTIVAMRPVAPTQPFELPDSIRLIEPAMPEGAILMGPPGGFIDPGLNKITVTNRLVNYGWEYVWHCHILSHEEMDMMHPLAFTTAPWAPTNLAMNTPGVLTWTDNSIAETGFRLQRATDAGFSQNLSTFPIGKDVFTFTDLTYNTSVAYYYRLFADNTIGDGTNYGAGTVGFPTMTSSSVSNMLFVASLAPQVAITGNTGTGNVTLSYTDVTAKTVVSDAAGNYSITVPAGWNGVVTPSKAGNSFIPLNRTYAALAASVAGENYSTFSKIAPVSGMIGSVVAPTLAWSNAGATGYEYCVDTSNNDTCNTAWVNATTNLSAVAAGLLNGTSYYWQARANGAIEADGGNWWTFTTQSGAFSKLTPVNASAVAGVSTTITWAPSAGATAYWYCYDMTNNATCDNPWVRAGTATSAKISNLIRGKTYYWQVRAEAATFPVYANGGAWYTFETSFAKISPTNLTNGITGSTRTLSWGAATGATAFEYCIDNSNDKVCDTGWVSTGTATTASVSIVRGQSYYWQVRAVTGTIYTYADKDTWWSFSTLAGSFAKTSPANGALGVSKNLTLTWNSSAGATYFEYCLTTTPQTLGTTCDTTWVPNGTALSVNLTNLTPNQMYYWQVRSFFAGAYYYGSSNIWWNFTVANNPPGDFTKATPANASNNLTSAPTITWNSSTGAVSYEYCVDTVFNTVCDTTWVTNGASTTKALSGLSASTTYYWQVRAVNPDGVTVADVGTWWSFMTAPGAFSKSTPANAAAGLGTTVSLSWAASSGAASYEVCFDTTNDNACTTWINRGTTRSYSATGLTRGQTYYWQVRANSAGGTTLANAGTWWSFSTIAGSFVKSGPTNNAIGISLTPNLSWGFSTGATAYEYCVTTEAQTTGTSCPSGWVTNGSAQAVTLSTPLANNTRYYWQVRSLYAGAYYYANSNAWWNFRTLP